MVGFLMTMSAAQCTLEDMDEQDPQPQQPFQRPSSDDLDGTTGVSERGLMAALSYVGVLVLVPLLLRRDNPFVVFHAKQGLVVLLGFIVSLLAAQWIAVVGSTLFLVLLVLDVIALVQALLGRRWRIPGISYLADRFQI